MNRISNRPDISVSCLCKGPERYILLFDDLHRSEALRQLGRWAANRKLSFSWADAAKMSQDIRKGVKP